MSGDHRLWVRREGIAHWGWWVIRAPTNPPSPLSNPLSERCGWTFTRRGAIRRARRAYRNLTAQSERIEP